MVARPVRHRRRGRWSSWTRPAWRPRQSHRPAHAGCAQPDRRQTVAGRRPRTTRQPRPPAGLFRLVVDQVGAARPGQVHRFATDWESRRQSAPARRRRRRARRLRPARPHRTAAPKPTWKTPPSPPPWPTGPGACERSCWPTPTRQAARLAGRARDHLVAAGSVDDTLTVELGDGNRAGVGDQIVTRDNDRTNRSDRRAVRGQPRHLADHLRTPRRRPWPSPGSTPTATRPLADDIPCLDAAYVAEHVQLDYAGTVHAAQGATGARRPRHHPHRTTRHGLLRGPHPGTRGEPGLRHLLPTRRRRP